MLSCRSSCQRLPYSNSQDLRGWVTKNLQDVDVVKHREAVHDRKGS